MDIDFRRINVDIYDPDNMVTEEDLIPPSLQGLPEVTVSEIQNVGQSVRSAISRGDHSGALTIVLDSPPYVGSDEVKNIHLTTVLEVLSTIKANDISKLVQSLSTEQRDTLIKYIYKGFSVSDTHGLSGVLLNWFEKVIDVTGQGAIMRYISDRRRV
ncbi:actin-related protein 2/3 complex subunit 5 [Dipodascopsis uninucleata]